MKLCRAKPRKARAYSERRCALKFHIHVNVAHLLADKKALHSPDLEWYHTVNCVFCSYGGVLKNSVHQLNSTFRWVALLKQSRQHCSQHNHTFHDSICSNHFFIVCCLLYAVINSVISDRAARFLTTFSLRCNRSKMNNSFCLQHL